MVDGMIGSIKEWWNRRNQARRKRMFFPAEVTGYHPQVALHLATLSQWAYPNGDCLNFDYQSSKEYLEDIDNKGRESRMWGFLDLHHIYSEKLRVLALIINGNRDTIIVFRGTVVNNYLNWNLDLRAWFKKEGKLGCVHQGFYDAIESLWPEIQPHIPQETNHSLWLTGHSLGGALALLAAAKIAHQFENPGRKIISGIYAFGAPRVGDEEFRDFFNASLKDRCFSFANYNDMVTVVPPSIKKIMGYGQVGQVIFFDKNGKALVKERLSHFETGFNFLSGNFRQQLAELSWQKVTKDWKTFKYFIQKGFSDLKQTKTMGQTDSKHWNKISRFVSRDLPGIEKGATDASEAEDRGYTIIIKLIMDIFVELFMELNPYVVESHTITTYIKNIKDNDDFNFSRGGDGD